MRFLLVPVVILTSGCDLKIFQQYYADFPCIIGQCPGGLGTIRIQGEASSEIATAYSQSCTGTRDERAKCALSLMKASTFDNSTAAAQLKYAIDRALAVGPGGAGNPYPALAWCGIANALDKLVAAQSKVFPGCLQVYVAGFVGNPSWTYYASYDPDRPRLPCGWGGSWVGIPSGDG